MAFILGVTGGIGSGKSEVTQRFAALGITVVDADEMARVVVEPDQPALAEIAKHFGAQVLTAEGHLDRAYLRTKIFTDLAERQWLEALLHPLINQEIRARLSQAQSPYAILSSPLLLETTQHQLVNRILVVDVPEIVQLERASQRDGNNREQIAAIMAAQLPRQERTAKADDILDNSNGFTHLNEQVKLLHEKYLQLSTVSH